MPEQEPRLRSVAAAAETEESARGGGVSTSSRLTLLLGLALGVALVLLVWSRLQLGSRIDVLETEARALEQIVVDREATIAEQRATITAHEQRLGEVRSSVAALADLVSQPVEVER